MSRMFRNFSCFLFCLLLLPLSSLFSEEEAGRTNDPAIHPGNDPLQAMESLQANFPFGGSSPSEIITPSSLPDNTWIPRFVWIGDVKNSDNLKCFAAFLIGSLTDKEGQKQLSASADPGVFITPDISSSVSNREEAPLAMSSPILAKSGHEAPLSSKKSPKCRESEQPVWSNTFMGLQAGVGFLYFDGVKGNLLLKPFSDFSTEPSSTDLRIHRKLQYNRTPLMEMFFGFHLRKWLDFVVNFQTQQGIHIATPPRNFTNANAYSSSHFESDLALNSVTGGLRFNWNNFCRSKSWTCDLFVAGAAGGGWQTWTSVTDFINRVQARNPATVLFRSKNFFNFVYNADAGITFLSKNPFSKTSLTFGCKFLAWGQTRGLGEIKDQGSLIGLFQPVTIQGIYSCAPYMGFGWNF